MVERIEEHLAAYLVIKNNQTLGFLVVQYAAEGAAPVFPEHRFAVAIACNGLFRAIGFKEHALGRDEAAVMLHKILITQELRECNLRESEHVRFVVARHVVRFGKTCQVPIRAYFV